MTKEVKLDFTSYAHIPQKPQEIMFARNCLNYAKMYLQSNDPIFNLMALSLFVTADNVHTLLKENSN